MSFFSKPSSNEPHRQSGHDMNEIAIRALLCNNSKKEPFHFPKKRSARQHEQSMKEFHYLSVFDRMFTKHFGMRSKRTQKDVKQRESSPVSNKYSIVSLRRTQDDEPNDSSSSISLNSKGKDSLFSSTGHSTVSLNTKSDVANESTAKGQKSEKITGGKEDHSKLLKLATIEAFNDSLKTKPNEEVFIGRDSEQKGFSTEIKGTKLQMDNFNFSSDNKSLAYINAVQVLQDAQLCLSEIDMCQENTRT